MLEKTGRFGKYLACQNYPECQNIKSINKVEFSVTSVTETLKALILLNSSGDSYVLKLSRQLSPLSQKQIA